MIRIGGALTIGVVLVWTRLVGLDASLWNDEAFTIVHYIDGGPGEILFGDYQTNNHLLFNLLAWGTTSTFGDSEAAYRIWSVLPAIASVGVVCGWLWRRGRPLLGLGVAAIATASPYHWDLSQQARGYGLCFLFSSLMLVAADSATRGWGRRGVAAVFAAGAAGIATLPVFVLAFLGQVAALFTRPGLRRSLMVGLGVVAAVSIAIYAPLSGGVQESAALGSGNGVPWHERVLAPLRVARPSLDLLVGRHVEAGALVVGSLALAGAWSVWRRDDRALALNLLAPPVAVGLLMTILQLHVEDRFVAFLFFHVAVLVALGIAAGASLAGRAVRDPRAPRAVALGLALLAAVALVRLAREHQRSLAKPREAFKEAGAAVHASGVRRVVTNSSRPVGLQQYLGRRGFTVLEHDALARLFCTTRAPLAFVYHPFRSPQDPRPAEVDFACLIERGATRLRFPQRERGGFMEVWILTPTA
ncbi:MAG: hypothetical protein M3340_01080 [Actinomycetota bacterium]|nr:hypothetical protein [Actinomycetota bacterium]